MSDTFNLIKNTYNLRNFHIFKSQNPRTRKLGLHSIAYRASQLWKNFPEEIWNSASLPIFKEKIKKVHLIPCSFHCYRKYVRHVGFISLFYIFNWISLSTSSCSPEFKINLAPYIIFTSGQYEALVDFIGHCCTIYLIDSK